MVAPLTHDPMFWGLNSADTGTEREKITKYIKIPIYLLVSEVFNLFFPKKSFCMDCANTSFLGSCHDLINYLASGSSKVVEPWAHNPKFQGLNSAATDTGSRKIANYY